MPFIQCYHQKVLQVFLWKDDSRVQEAAEVMKLTSYDLYEKGIVDYLVKEPTGGMQNDLKLVLDNIDQYLQKELDYFNAYKRKRIVRKTLSEIS